MADGVLTVADSSESSIGSSLTAFVAVAFFVVFGAGFATAFLGATVFFVVMAFFGAAVLAAVAFVAAGAVFLGAGAGVADLAFLVLGSSPETSETSEALRLVADDLVTGVAEAIVVEGLAAFADLVAAVVTVEVFAFVVVAGFAAGVAFLGGMLTVSLLQML
jgi:hypothetical protein